jgi:hypothetical protein
MLTKEAKKYKVTLEWENHTETLPENVQSFAWDECHKIYLIENEEQKKEALENEYTIFPINKLKSCYRKSCGLKFIAYWDLDKKKAVEQTDFRPDIYIEEIV